MLLARSLVTLFPNDESCDWILRTFKLFFHICILIQEYKGCDQNNVHTVLYITRTALERADIYRVEY